MGFRFSWEILNKDSEANIVKDVSPFAVSFTLPCNRGTETPVPFSCLGTMKFREILLHRPLRTSRADPALEAGGCLLTLSSAKRDTISDHFLVETFDF